MKSQAQIADPDLAAVGKALARAAKRARQLSIDTGTPFYVWTNGRLVDLLAAKSKSGRRRSLKKRKN